MEMNQDTINDPWLQKDEDKASLPNDLLFAYAWELDIGLEVIEKASFYRRSQTRDELWLAAVLDFPCIREITTGHLHLKS